MQESFIPAIPIMLSWRNRAATFDEALPRVDNLLVRKAIEVLMHCLVTKDVNFKIYALRLYMLRIVKANRGSSTARYP